jgi:hypothetical protein
MLIDTDLLRHQQKWKEGLKDIRDIMSQVEDQVCRFMVLYQNNTDLYYFIALYPIFKPLVHVISCDCDIIDFVSISNEEVSKET